MKNLYLSAVFRCANQWVVWCIGNITRSECRHSGVGKAPRNQWTARAIARTVVKGLDNSDENRIVSVTDSKIPQLGYEHVLIKRVYVGARALPVMADLVSDRG